MKMRLESQKSSAMLRKDNGFTMIEMLISLVVFMMLAFLVSQIFLTVRENITKKDQLHLKEWEIFSIQLKNEIRNSKDQSVINNKLYLLTRGNIVTIEHYKNIVRRQVDGMGHEIMLQNVADFQVKQDGSAIIIQVTDNEGLKYNRRFHPYFKKELGKNE